MKRLLIEYQVFISHMKEIEEFLSRVDKNAELDKIIAAIDDDIETKEYVNYIKSLSSSPLSYNAIIISLYGCFENYIDKLLGTYLEILTENIQNYEDLPNALKNRYRFKIGEFLTNPQRFSGLDLIVENEVHNYNRILESKLDGMINKRLALSHSGNLHAREVFDLMTILGIDNARSQILGDHLFKTHYINSGMEEIEYDMKRARDNDELFSPIEQLIDQRNSVAHSWNVDDRLTLREIANFVIPYMLMFSECLYRLCAICAFSLQKNCPVLEKDKPIMVIDKNIVCMNSQNRKISVGDYIIYTSHGVVKIAKIINIQVDSKDIADVASDEAKDIGMELDNTIKSTDKLKLILNAM